MINPGVKRYLEKLKIREEIPKEILEYGRSASLIHIETRDIPVDILVDCGVTLRNGFHVLKGEGSTHITSIGPKMDGQKVLLYKVGNVTCFVYDRGLRGKNVLEIPPNLFIVNIERMDYGCSDCVACHYSDLDEDIVISGFRIHGRDKVTIQDIYDSPKYDGVIMSVAGVQYKLKKRYTNDLLVKDGVVYDKYAYPLFLHDGPDGIAEFTQRQEFVRYRPDKVIPGGVEHLEIDMEVLSWFDGLLSDVSSVEREPIFYKKDGLIDAIRQTSELSPLSSEYYKVLPTPVYRHYFDGFYFCVDMAKTIRHYRENREKMSTLHFTFREMQNIMGESIELLGNQTSMDSFAEIGKFVSVGEQPKMFISELMQLIPVFANSTATINVIDSNIGEIPNAFNKLSQVNGHPKRVNPMPPLRCVNSRKKSIELSFINCHVQSESYKPSSSNIYYDPPDLSLLKIVQGGITLLILSKDRVGGYGLLSRGVNVNYYLIGDPIYNSYFKFFPHMSDSPPQIIPRNAFVTKDTKVYWDNEIELSCNSVENKTFELKPLDYSIVPVVSGKKNNAKKRKKNGVSLSAEVGLKVKSDSELPMIGFTNEYGEFESNFNWAKFHGGTYRRTLMFTPGQTVPDHKITRSELAARGMYYCVTRDGLYVY